MVKKKDGEFIYVFLGLGTLKKWPGENNSI